MPIYISSSAFPSRKINDIFKICRIKGIKNLELGSAVAFDRDVKSKVIKASKSMNILLHNYFPAPKQAFALNLASLDKDILQKSKNIVLKAVEISSEIRAPVFAFHAGLSYFAEATLLGTDEQKNLKHFPTEEAEKIFENSVFELSARAKSYGVRMLIENNVISKSSLDHGVNKTCLMADIDNSLLFLKKFRKIDIGLLLDTGHLQVAAKTMKFDKNKYVESCSEYISALHVSENNLKFDQHLPLKENSWAMKVIKQFFNKPVTIEVSKNINAAISNAELLNTLIS